MKLEILGWVKKKRRRLVTFQLRKIVKGYTEVSTPLEKYLPEWAVEWKKNKVELAEITQNIGDLQVDSSTDGEYASSEQETDAESGEEESSEEESKDSIDFVAEDEEKVQEIVTGAPAWLLEQSRKGLLHSSIMTLLSLRTYFCVPQVENYSENCAARKSLNLLTVVCSLTLGDNGPFSVYYRNGSSYDSCMIDRYNFERPWLPPPALPSLEEIPKLSVDQRTEILLHSLGIDFKDVKTLNTCPSQWKLFFASILVVATDLKPYHLFSLFVMLIAVGALDSKIGHYRNKRNFMRRYGSQMKAFLKSETDKGKKNDKFNSVSDALEALSTRDCILIFERFLPYFHVDDNLKNNLRCFRPEVVHTYAVLQQFLELANILNGLLQCPLQPCQIGKIYNGTFLYNFTINLKNRSNIDAYMQSFCMGAPTILTLYMSMCSTFNAVIEKIISDIPIGKQRKGKKKKSRRKEKKFNPKIDSELSDESVDDNDNYVDQNNPFSVLTCSNH